MVAGPKTLLSKGSISSGVIRMVEITAKLVEPAGFQESIFTKFLMDCFPMFH